MILKVCGEPFDRGAKVKAIGMPEVARHSVPVGDLLPRDSIGLFLRSASRQRIAVDVLELGGELANDPCLAFGRQLWQRQVRPDERAPVTHRSSP